jgi:hypothetical protein
LGRTFIRVHKTPFLQMQAANAEALVGKNAMFGFLAVMNTAPDDIKKLNNAINNCDGTAEKMFIEGEKQAL